MPEVFEVDNDEVTPVEDLPPFLTVTFAEPIKFNNKTYESVTLREPTVGEMEGAMLQPGIMKQMSWLISSLSLIGLGAVNQMKIRDFNKCQEYLMGFINARTTND